MTLANLIETGAGRIAIRWEIEGVSVQFCTEPGMEQTFADGRRVLCVTSLDECGFAIDEMANLPEATLEGKGTGLRLWETLDEDLAAVFHQQPTLERYGTTSIEETDSTISGLYSTTGITAGDVFHIGTEAILVLSVAATSINVTRGYWGTIAQKHWSSDSRTGDVPDIVLTNRPVRTRGRRVRCYLYGDGDDLQGAGTQVWIGVTTAEPALLGSGTAYQLSMDSLSSLLKTKIGADFADPVQPRGVYYPWSAGLRVRIFEHYASGPPSSADDVFTGFYETQRDFINALHLWLITTGASDIADAGFASTFVPYIFEGQIGWNVEALVGTGVEHLLVHLSSAQDGATGGDYIQMLNMVPGADINRLAAVGLDVLTVGQRVLPNWGEGLAAGVEPEGARTVPRGFYGRSEDLATHNTAASGLAPSHRFYVGREVLGRWTGAKIEWPGAGEDEQHSIYGSDETEDYFEALRLGSGTSHVYTSRLVPTITPTREIAQGHLGTFRDAIVADAPEWANLGVLPFLTSADLAEWTPTVLAASVFGWQRERYFSWSTAVEFDEVLSAEMQLLGLFLVTDSTGKLALAPLSIPNARTVTAFDIDEEISMIDGKAVDLSSMVRGNQTVNRIRMKTGYIAGEDEWSGHIEVVDRRSFAFDHQDRPLEIEPRSWATSLYGGPAVRADELAAVVLPVLGIFGYPHDFIDVKVTWKAFNLRLGDSVTFSADHLPNYLHGQRPITEITAMVVGRRWAMNQAHGELTLLMSWQNNAGYAPTARVAAQLEGASDLWDLVITYTHVPGGIGYYPTGSSFGDHGFFAAGDKVRIYNIDSESATVVTGEVVSVTDATSTIRVQFDSTWTPGSEVWELIFAKYSDCTESQKTYAFMAGRDLLLGSSDAPRTLAP